MVTLEQKGFRLLDIEELINEVEIENNEEELENLLIFNMEQVEMAKTISMATIERVHRTMGAVFIIEDGIIKGIMY